MATTTTIHIRVDEQVSAQATEILAAMGLSVSDAVRMFLMRVIADQKIPFAIKTPNAETIADIDFEPPRMTLKPRPVDFS